MNTRYYSSAVDYLTHKNSLELHCNCDHYENSDEIEARVSSPVDILYWMMLLNTAS